jgi:hypothetical protein
MCSCNLIAIQQLELLILFTFHGGSVFNVVTKSDQRKVVSKKISRYAFIYKLI